MSLLDSDKYFQWDEQNQRFKVEWWRRAIIPTWLTFDITDQDLPLVIAATGTRTKPVHFAQPYSSSEGLDRQLGAPFIGKYFVYCDSTAGTGSASYTILLRDPGMGRDFMNRPIHIRNIAGTAQLPLRLREPLYFPSRHNVLAEFAKLTGGAVYTRFYMHGPTVCAYDPILEKYPEDGNRLRTFIKRWNERLRYIQPIWLTTDISDVTMTSGQTVTYEIKIGDDACVEIFGMTAVATGNFSLEISEVETKTTIANTAITQTNGVGTGQLPFIFPTPYLIRHGARLRLRFTDLSAGSNTVYMCLYGRKIYAPFKDARDAVRDLVVPTFADEKPQMVPPTQLKW